MDTAVQGILYSLQLRAVSRQKNRIQSTSIKTQQCLGCISLLLIQHIPTGWIVVQYQPNKGLYQPDLWHLFRQKAATLSDANKCMLSPCFSSGAIQSHLSYICTTVCIGRQDLMDVINQPRMVKDLAKGQSDSCLHLLSVFKLCIIFT